MFDIGQRLPSFLRTTLKGYLKGVGGGRVKAVATIPNTDVTGLGTFATQNYAAPPPIGGANANTGAFSTLKVGGMFVDAKRQYIITPVASTWYRLGSLIADNLGQYVELYVFCLHIAGTNPNDGVHQFFKLRISKGTSGYLGTVYEYNLLGHYDSTGGIAQIRVVDAGTNGPSYVDILFKTTDTYRVTVTVVNQAGESTQVFSDGALVSQGTTAAGVAWDVIANAYKFGDTILGPLYAVASATQCFIPQSVQVSGGQFPAGGTGAGVELNFSAGTGYVQSFDRTASVWKPLNINAASFSFGIGGSVAGGLDANGRLSCKTFSNKNYYNAGATTTLDMNNGGFQYFSISAAATLTANNAVSGDVLYLAVKNTGASTVNLTVPGPGGGQNAIIGVAASNTVPAILIYTGSGWFLLSNGTPNNSYTYP